MNVDFVTDSVACDEWLDPAELLRRLAPAVATGELALASAEPDYLRVKPGVSALLGLRLGWRGTGGSGVTRASLYIGAGAREAAAKSATLREVAPAWGPTRLLLDGPAALLLAFPNDRALRGLTAAADPRRLGNRLAAIEAPMASSGWRVRRSKTRIETVRWKPGRRAVLRAELALKRESDGARRDQTIWIRVWPSHEFVERLARWRAAAAHPALGAPALVAADAERAFAAFEPAVGGAWSGELALLEPALRTLYGARAPLPLRTDADDLAAALRTLAALGALRPQAAARTRSLALELRRAFARLRAVAPALVHGDLKADQMLEDHGRVRLLDWDEAAMGDPHADFASLAADRAEPLDEAGTKVEQAADPGAARPSRAGDIATMARAVLGARFDFGRWRAQLAAAHARRALAALQRASLGWRAVADEALEAAESALGATAPPPLRIASPVALLLDRGARPGLPGVNGRKLALTAVWPEDEGVIARLEEPECHGASALWLRIAGSRVTPYEFPDDPALPDLARLIGAGGFSPAGHRLGKRAVLRCDSDARYLYLRPAARADRARAAVREAARRLASAGVPHVSMGPDAEGASGWWMDASPGRPLPADALDGGTWEALGFLLARVHATGRDAAGRGDELSAAGAATRRQIVALVVHAPEFGSELDRLSREWAARDAGDSGRGTPAFAHGDLHPGQFVVGDQPMILDWERSRPAIAELDLGNLAAHLAWELGTAARGAWIAFGHGYTRGEGGWCPAAFRALARRAMARVLAVWWWRDQGRRAASDLARWREWGKEVESW